MHLDDQLRRGAGEQRRGGDLRALGDDRLRTDAPHLAGDPERQQGVERQAVERADREVGQEVEALVGARAAREHVPVELRVVGGELAGEPGGQRERVARAADEEDPWLHRAIIASTSPATFAA